MAQKSVSEFLSLDEHSRPFFAQKWHDGEVEVCFPIYAPSFEGVCFAARLAQLLTGDGGAILQEQRLGIDSENTERQFIFRISEVNSPPVKNPDSKRQVKRFWERLLSPIDPNSPQDKSKILSGYICEFLARPHFDNVMQAGCLVKVEGGYELFDSLKVTPSGHAEFFTIEPKPQALFGPRELLELEEVAFHRQMTEYFEIPQGVLPESIRFSRMSENEICQEILGRSLAICCEVESTLGVLLGYYLKEGLELAHWKEAEWRMLTDEPLRGFDIDGQDREKEVWPDLRALRNKVLKSFGCHLPPYHTITPPEDLSIRAIKAQSLASKFVCRCDSPISAHEFLEALSYL